MIEILLHTLGIPHPEGADGYLLTYVQQVCNYLAARR